LHNADANLNAAARPARNNFLSKTGVIGSNISLTLGRHARHDRQGNRRVT
jgi:hypothetical protein